MDSNGPRTIQVVMPTFIMHPTEDERFRRNKISQIVAETLKQQLEGKEYDEDEAKEWGVVLADAIKLRIKKECYAPRYKIIVQVVVGQQKHQDVRIASRGLWDNDHDNHASGTFNNHSLWATGLVFGLYAD